MIHILIETGVVALMTSQFVLEEINGNLAVCTNELMDPSNPDYIALKNKIQQLVRIVLLWSLRVLRLQWDRPWKPHLLSFNNHKTGVASVNL